MRKSMMHDYQEIVRMISCGIMQSRNPRDLLYYMLIVIVKCHHMLDDEDFAEMARNIKKANPQNEKGAR